MESDLKITTLVEVLKKVKESDLYEIAKQIRENGDELKKELKRRVNNLQNNEFDALWVYMGRCLDYSDYV